VEKIPEAALQAGDLVFFNTTGMISHVGIYAGKGKFIHSASSGPKTGVMYSQLDEKYWRRTYAGAGRALPPGDRALSGPAQAGVSRPADGDRASAPGGGEAPGDRPAAFFAGIGLGSTWGSYSEDAGPLRGGVMQARLAYNLTVFDQPILIGLELRPEWDGSLEIFRMPFTLSLGFNDVIRIFGGPAFTIGEPVLKTNGGDRRYSGGNSWLGSLGISAAPFAVDFAGGALSLYGEFAWQSYTRGEGQEDNPNADFSAGFRFSTGVRYTRKL
jgi:probable lipoprotein NlpC